MNSREGNEESSEEARAEKARVYVEIGDYSQTEKFVNPLEFTHFERHPAIKSRGNMSRMQAYYMVKWREKI